MPTQCVWNIACLFRFFKLTFASIEREIMAINAWQSTKAENTDYQPDEILLKILGYLSPQDLSVAKFVCLRLFIVARDPSLYHQALKDCRAHFPLVAGRDDGLNFNTYQKVLRCVKRICMYDAKARGVVQGTNNAFVDAANIIPYDGLIQQALEDRRDQDLYLLCKSRLSSHPTAVVQQLLHLIMARNGHHLMPQLNMDWMLVHSLKRYIQEMPPSCIKSMLKELPSNDVYALVAYLYPLRINIKMWRKCGLNLEVKNSNGEHLGHMVMYYIDHIQWRCQLNRLDQLVPEVAFTDANRLVKSFADNQFLNRVSSLIKKKPSALPGDIENAQNSVEQLTEEFQQLGGRNTPELMDVAAKCDNLVRTTQNVARGQANKRRRLHNPNEGSMVKRIRQDILQPHVKEALEDMTYLNMYINIHAPDNRGTKPDQIAWQNRRRYSNEHLTKITEIFQAPERSSQ